MPKPKCNIRIGTSGWHYDHWQGRFYPADLPKNKWLDFYAQHFDTVEINNTFYHLPKAQTFQNWHKQVPQSFLFAVKANRYITHIKKLKDPQDSLNLFFERASLLKDNLGPVLYQLPPNFHKDLDRLRTFLLALPERRIAVFEFRHASWFSDDTYTLLKDFNAAFCIHDLPCAQPRPEHGQRGGAGLPACLPPKVITSDTIYLRFHGTTGRYAGNYTERHLRSCADWLKEHLKGITALYAYFNNDANAYAVTNAIELKKILT